MAEDIKYSPDHIWVRTVGKKRVRLGISEYVQEKLGSVDFVTLPDVGDSIEKTDHFGEIESSDTVFELVSPVTGSVLEVNEEVTSYPSLLNSDPLGEGWLIEVEVDNTSWMDELMDADEYEEFVEQKSGEEI